MEVELVIRGEIEEIRQVLELLDKKEESGERENVAIKDIDAIVRQYVYYYHPPQRGRPPYGRYRKAIELYMKHGKTIPLDIVGNGNATKIVETGIATIRDGYLILNDKFIERVKALL